MPHTLPNSTHLNPPKLASSPTYLFHSPKNVSSKSDTYPYPKSAQTPHIRLPFDTCHRTATCSNLTEPIAGDCRFLLYQIISAVIDVLQYKREWLTINPNVSIGRTGERPFPRVRRGDHDILDFAEIGNCMVDERVLLRAFPLVQDVEGTQGRGGCGAIQQKSWEEDFDMPHRFSAWSLLNMVMLRKYR